jgi:hydrogenase maturation protease
MKHGATNQQTRPTPILVIGYGNPYRRDDGAGLVLAQKLANYWASEGIHTRLLTGAQLLPEMACDIADDNSAHVLFVDTVDTTVSATDIGIQVSPIELDVTSPTLGHHLEPATLISFAALLFGSYPRAWLVTVPGVDFGHGEGFSDEVDKVLSNVPMLARQLLSEMEELNYA